MSSRFITHLRVEQIDDELWRLLEPLVYYSQKLQRSLAVPAGFVTDFASVPRLPFVYWLLGGRASKAAVIHDLLYRKGSGVSRADADAILVEAMQATGQAPWRQRLMWQGLRIGGSSSYQQRELDWKGPAMGTSLSTHLVICFAIAAAILLAGCAGPNPQLTPDQILADAKNKDATVHCAAYDTLPTDVSVMRVNVDKGVIDSGSLEVKCGGNSVTYTNAKAPK